MITKSRLLILLLFISKLTLTQVDTLKQEPICAKADERIQINNQC